ASTVAEGGASQDCRFQPLTLLPEDHENGEACNEYDYAACAEEDLDAYLESLPKSNRWTELEASCAWLDQANIRIEELDLTHGLPEHLVLNQPRAHHAPDTHNPHATAGGAATSASTAAFPLPPAVPSASAAAAATAGDLHHKLSSHSSFSGVSTNSQQHKHHPTLRSLSSSLLNHLGFSSRPHSSPRSSPSPSASASASASPLKSRQAPRRHSKEFALRPNPQQQIHHSQLTSAPLPIPHHHASPGVPHGQSSSYSSSPGAPFDPIHNSSSSPGMPLAPLHQSSSSPRLPLAPIHQASFHHSSSSPGMLVHPSGVPLTKFAVPEHSGVQYQPGVLYSHMDGADLGGSSGIYSAKFIDAEEEVSAIIGASAAIENRTAIIEASTAIEATEAAPSSTPRGDSVGTAGDDGGLNADTAANANRGHWREDEVIELVKAHVELDPEYHIMRGVQGSNYYGELYRILRAKFPDFRHTEGSVKTKLFRLKGQYLQLRDRIERSASAAPRNLPEWFVLLDTVMARESSNRQTATAANQQSSRVTHPSTNSGRMAALLTNAGQERKLLSAETPAYAFPVTPTWLDTAGQSGLTRNSLFQNVASTPEPPVSAPPPPPATISPFAGGGGSGSYLLSLRNSITPVPTRETGRLRMGTGGFGEGRKKRGAAARGAGMLSGPEASIAAAMAEKFAAAMGSAVRNACFQFEELTRELLENSCSQFEELSARLAENAAAQFEDVARELAANFVANQEVKRRRR
ncbi:unnamed protein product, partial [Closterium sp. NIES-53]